MDVKVDVTDVIIETQRVILRFWEKSDLDDFYAYASTPGLGEMAGWPHHRTKWTTRRVLNSFIEGKNVLAIVYRDNNKVIGSVGLNSSWANEDERYKDLKLKDVGYALSKDYWGQGLTPEAVKALIDWCFTQTEIEALTCGHFKDNYRSKRVIEKCGFSFVMEGKYHAKQLNMIIDDAKYILFRTQ